MSSLPVNWGAIATIVDLILRIVLKSVPTVEALSGRFGSLGSRDKQDAVMELVRGALRGTRGFGEADLASRPDVDTAVRQVIDAVVNLNTVLANVNGIPEG